MSGGAARSNDRGVIPESDGALTLLSHYKEDGYTEAEPFSIGRRQENMKFRTFV